MKLGPISAVTGFSLWYEDENGLRLMLNFDPNDPFSLVTPADLPNPSQPVLFPDNFPSEAFYFTAEAEMETGTRERARLVLALEAAFVNEIPRNREQIVFGRVRIRVAGLQPGVEYTVSHPYGIDTFVAEDDGDGGGEINFTEDIGGLNGGNFEIALTSRIDPFVTWDPNVPPSPPIGYIGDPNVDHPITGSQFVDRFGQPLNIFRIEGPGIGIGSPNRATTPGFNPDNCIETKDFSVSGKISTIVGVDVTRTTYTQSDSTGGFIDVFAVSDVGQEIVVTGNGFNPTQLEGENGFYYARVSYVGEEIPSIVTVTNVGDNNPSSVKDSVPVDFITAKANYDNDSNILTIEATTSDQFGPIDLSVVDFGQGELFIPDSGVLTVNNLIGVPANVTIQSTAGGVITIPVAVAGLENPPIGVSANAGVDQTVLVNSFVQLDGTGSTGTINAYQWTQVLGEPVALTGADTETPSFTAPSVGTTLRFQLTVFGEGGSSTETVDVIVGDSAETPVANAGPDQTVQQGTVVTLSGSATGEATTYRWEQISGPPVQLINPNVQTTSFVFPKQLASLQFLLTASGPGGSSTDIVEISTVPDVLTVTRVEFRTGDSEWRISGTSSVVGPGVTVTIIIGNTLNGPVLAQVEVDTLGDWEYRIEPSQVAPDATRAISIQSSSGGTQINVPINIRN